MKKSSSFPNSFNILRHTDLFRLQLPLAVLLVLIATSARADFYRYTGDDGVEVYTNMPTKRAAVRVLREERRLPEAKREPRAQQQANPQPAPATGSRWQGARARGPLLPVYGTVTSTVGWRHDPIDGGLKHHSGVDIAVPVGTPVRAIAAGRVVESAWRGGYGNLVAIDHGDGTFSMYGHNSSLEVRVGDQVEAGQTVANSGSTGRSTGPHLHFELWKNGSNVTESYLGSGARVAEAGASTGTN